MYHQWIKHQDIFAIERGRTLLYILTTFTTFLVSKNNCFNKVLSTTVSSLTRVSTYFYFVVENEKIRMCDDCRVIFTKIYWNWTDHYFTPQSVECIKVYKKTDSSEILLNLNISFTLFFPLFLFHIKTFLKNQINDVFNSVWPLSTCILCGKIWRHYHTWRCQRRKQIPFLCP